MDPEFAFKLVDINPYHGRPPADNYELAALAVIADLCDRRGIAHQLESIDEEDEVRAEIVAALTAIIRAAILKSTPSA